MMIMDGRDDAHVSPMAEGAITRVGADDGVGDAYASAQMVWELILAPEERDERIKSCECEGVRCSNEGSK